MKICVLKRQEIRGQTKFHSSNLIICTVLPNNIRVMKLINMRWAGHVARLGEKKFVDFRQET
jgi:hypothetical protein